MLTIIYVEKRKYPNYIQLYTTIIKTITVVVIVEEVVTIIILINSEFDIV